MIPDAPFANRSCAAVGCKGVAPRFMCTRHWNLVPRRLQLAVQLARHAAAVRGGGGRRGVCTAASPYGAEMRFAFGDAVAYVAELEGVDATNLLGRADIAHYKLVTCKAP